MEAAIQSGNDKILSTLPPDVLLDVARRLSYLDIIRLCRTSSVFNQLFCIENFGNLWKYLYHRDISTHRLPASGDYYLAYRVAIQGIPGIRPILQIPVPPLPSFRQPSTRPQIQPSTRSQRQRVSQARPSQKLLNQRLEYAVRNGYEKLAEDLLDQGANNYDDAMALAALNGYSDLVDLMLSRGATNYNQTMVQAASGGHEDIIDQMLALGATHIDQVVVLAAREGHWNIVNRFLDQLATPETYEVVLYQAARYDNIVLMNDMINRLGPGPRIYNNALAGAARGGHREIVNRMLELGATNYDWAMAAATGGNHYAIVKQMLSLGATDYRTALSNTDVNTDPRIVELLRSGGRSG